MASRSRNVELSKFDEHWVVFLMKEYTRRLGKEIERMTHIDGLDADIHNEMLGQGQWMLDYADQRNKETCENLGIDPAVLRE